MKGVWLFLGPENGLKQQEINKIIKEIESSIPQGEEIEKTKFFAGDADSFSIASEIQTPSLFSRYRIIQIYQVDLWQASDTKSIAKAIQSKNEDTFIIMVSDATKMGTTIDKLVEKKSKKIFWQLTNQDYSEYVARRAEQLGLKIHQDAIDVLVYIGGESTLELDNLITQIATFRNVQKEELEKRGEQDTSALQNYIMKDDVDLWLSHFKQETIFKLFEDLSKAQYEKAFLTLKFLLQAGEHPAQLMAGLIYQLRNALRLAQRLKRNEPAKSILLSLNIRNFASQNQYQKFISCCTEKALQTMLQICVSTEEILRSGGNAQFQEIIMSRMLYQICMLHHSKSYKPYTEKSKSYYNISNIYLYDW